MNYEELRKPSQAELLQSQIELIRKNYTDQRSIDLFLETYPLSLELGKERGVTPQQVRAKELERISALEAHSLFKKDPRFNSEFHSMANYHPDLSMQRIIISRDIIHDNNPRLTEDAADSLAHYDEVRRLDLKADTIMENDFKKPGGEVERKVNEIRIASRMIEAEKKSLHARDAHKQLSKFLGDKENIYITHIRGTNSTIKPVRHI